MKPPHKRAPLTREQKMFSRGLLSIFDGRKCIGHLLVRPHSGVEAFDVDDRSLGLFPDIGRRRLRDGGGDAVTRVLLAALFGLGLGIFLAGSTLSAGLIVARLLGGGA
jgi:hypothetical protein